MRAETDGLCALIPAYQAAPYAGAVVERTLPVVPRLLVVDDGSTDGTGEVAQNAGAEVVRIEVNSGKSAALRHGFEVLLRRGATAVVTLDADGQHLPGEIPKLVEGWQHGADLVLGIRTHLFDEMSAVRRASNRLSSRAISLAAGTELTDIQTGFRIYSRRLLGAVPFRGERFAAESAVVVRAARRGFPIASIPIRLGNADGRSTSHYRPLIDSFLIAGAVIRARMEKQG